MPNDFSHVRAVAQQAVEAGVVPGLVLGVHQADKVQFLDAFGHQQTVPDAQGLSPDTVYDVASLTKALVTSLLGMHGVSRGIWALDDSLGQHLPSLADRPAVTLRLALAHAGGFAAHRPFFQQVLVHGEAPAEGREQILALAAAEPLAYEPGTRSLYSDLGFMLLGELIERGLGDRLDVLADRLVFAPLGLTATGFAGASVLAGRSLAPTEQCPVRGRLLSGEVHDLNAFAMGGVAGHAGLFANAPDLLNLSAALCAAWREAGPAGGAPLVPTQVLRLFWQPAGIAGSTWRLGWDGPAATGSLAGDHLSRQAVGHLGFTGCSLWIDPERETGIVLLTNFVHPTVRRDPRFRELRPALNDAILDAIGYRTR